jgi:hypothetical protein
LEQMKLHLDHFNLVGDRADDANVTKSDPTEAP